MPLTSGTRLGQYEIVGLLGAGGMGEVYRARDPKLNREVALKIVSEAFASDPPRLARFEREARALAALNHPNIGGIYDFEDSGETKALVLELVDGPTLAECLINGPMPLDEAVRSARQIAEALEAAHESGIVHRDLKPANVKLKADGTIKVLDFGLAKALDGDAALRAETLASGAQTKTGVVLGTTAYMAPEQARGKPLDKRADIWAFGCVLYEMLTGQPAFIGEDDSEVRARIIEREPNLDALPAATPPAIRRLVRRCLAKNPAARLRDIGDARIELDEALAEDGPYGDRPKPGRAAGREVLAWSAALAALVLVAALVVFGFVRFGGDTPREIVRTQIILPADQALVDRVHSLPLAISPDGRHIVYAAESEGRPQLYLRELGALDATPIAGTAGATQPFFSRDGQWVAFFARGMLQRVSLQGGAPLQICPVDGTTFGGSWGDDGAIVFATFERGLETVAASGGAPVRIPGTEGARWPERLPQSPTVLFVNLQGQIRSIGLDGGEPHVIAQTAAAPGEADMPVIGSGQLGPIRFVATGHLVFGHGAYRMRAVPFDPVSLTVEGAPVSMVDSVYRAADGGGLYFAIAANGTLVYAPEDPRRHLVWVDREGHSTPISDDLEAFRYPQLSPDGRYVAVDINTEERRSDIWIYDTERRTRQRLTGELHSLLPVWHPERPEVAYDREGSTGTEVILQRADGTGGPEVLASFDLAAYPTSWSPDARTLLLTVTDRVTGDDLWELAGSERPRPLLVRSAADSWPRFSPDGSLVAYVSDESGDAEVYVARYPGMTGQLRVSTRGGTWPIWAPDGSTIYYRQRNAVMAVPVVMTPTLQLGTPTPVIDGPFVGVDGDRKFDIAPDGRFLMIERVDAAAARQLVVVQNWTDELERRVPAR